MQKEVDFKNLSLKEYRGRFCKDFSLMVLKRAYCYSQNGHLPSNAIATAAVLYADPLKRRMLLQHGVMAQKEPNAVSIWDLQTETVSAQRSLLVGKWDFHNRSECIARLGENYDCQHQTTLDFPNELIIGVYQHLHRFVAVVSIAAICEAEQDERKVQEIADIVAQNALVYYPKYLREKEQIEFDRKHPEEGKAPKKLPEFRQFLLNQPLRFVKGVNPEYDLSRAAKRIVTIEEFIVFRSPLMQKLKVASIDMFGDF